MMAARFLALTLGLAAAEERRELASVGCDNCCFKNDCSLAFSMTQPGVCCGAHPYSNRRQTGCCPMGASCVACGNIWKCTRAAYVTRSSKCSMCRDDQVRECLYHRSYGHHYGGSSFVSGILLLLALFAIAACFFYGRDEPDVMYVQQGGVIGQPVGMGGQTVIMQGGCTLPATIPPHIYICPRARCRLPHCLTLPLCPPRPRAHRPHPTSCVRRSARSPLPSPLPNSSNSLPLTAPPPLARLGGQMEAATAEAA